MDEAEIAARQKKKNEIELVNSEQELKKHHREASKRYQVGDLKSIVDRKSMVGRKSEISKGLIEEESYDNPHVEIRTDQ